MPHVEGYDFCEGRVAVLPALAELVFVVGFVVLCADELEQGVRGVGCLDEDVAFLVAAPGASCHLHEHVEGTLVGAEVGEVEEAVGVDDSHHADVGEVEALADHLRTDEDVGLA